ncbi:killer cell lectin-like receptor subfamily B member 1C [Hyla sarda]|uniref:killer cell lectin-like receptor subfamily B member 1C n=1 Tax=Hyla sarda TaxID=327740 RepID=UPI0024C339A9|nr:killer cell lectin-like receptor subfamily B member 1C [Hyla sarda]
MAQAFDRKKELNRCSYKTLSRILVLIIVILSCAFGYMVYKVDKETCDKNELSKELCVNNSALKLEDCRLCPYHWWLHGEQCYYYSDTGRTWNQSRDHCKEMGADLLVIKDQEQQKFIRGIHSKQEGDDSYWIGLHHDGVGWRWVDGEQYNSSLFRIKEQSSGLCVLMTRSNYSQGHCMSAKGSICVKKSVRI